MIVMAEGDLVTVISKRYTKDPGQYWDWQPQRDASVSSSTETFAMYGDSGPALEYSTTS